MVTKKASWGWFKKFGYAFRGLYTSLKEEQSLVVHFVISVIVLIVSIVLYKQMDATDWAIIVITIAVVISMELINTAVENIIDVIMFEYNAKAKKIKDVAAAATLILTIASIIVGLCVFIPHIIELFK